MNLFTFHDQKQQINPDQQKEALLEDGRIVAYDICCRDKSHVDDALYRLLGKGTVYSINGVRQTNNHTFWFWSKR